MFRRPADVYCWSSIAHGTFARLVARFAVCAAMLAAMYPATAQQTPANQTTEPGSTVSPPASAAPSSPTAPSKSRPDLEAALIEMLSGATLEGSFTSTGPDRDPTKLSREKYTLGDVKKLAGSLWLIPARIEYGEHDVTLPITVPIEWAGDTPVVVVDQVGLPGFGAVSARVMFFADHYAGYWQHDDRGGHLFGTIHRDANPAATPPPPGKPIAPIRTKFVP